MPKREKENNLDSEPRQPFDLSKEKGIEKITIDTVSTNLNHDEISTRTEKLLKSLLDKGLPNPADAIEYFSSDSECTRDLDVGSHVFYASETKREWMLTKIEHHYSDNSYKTAVKDKAERSRLRSKALVSGQHILYYSCRYNTWIPAVIKGHGKNHKEYDLDIRQGASRKYIKIPNDGFNPQVALDILKNLKFEQGMLKYH